MGGGLGLRRRGAHRPLALLLVLVLAAAAAGAAEGKARGRVAHGSTSTRMRFRRGSGTFKVVQVADMHYADGRATGCEDVLPSQVAGCSDLNTTAFLYRVFRDEDPDLVVFTGGYTRCSPPNPLLLSSGSVSLLLVVRLALRFSWIE